MRIIMMTNTYLPHVGGVARSVSFFVTELRKRGHKVLVVAPQFKGMPKEEEDVLRIPALQNFNGSDFSVIIGTPPRLLSRLKKLRPQIIHSHHPFLLGSTALRAAARFQLPLVFTHHTMYEQYTHYVSENFPRMRQFVADLSTGYANLCNQVVAPSQSVASILRERGVEVPISIIPTGIDTAGYEQGDGAAWRSFLGIKPEARVIGFVSRLAPEKNLGFLAPAVAEAIKNSSSEIHFLVVGDGPSAEEIEQIFQEAGIADRLHLTGKLQGRNLVDAYHAMDIFTFASKSETQGLVLAEAMAAGLPVVALDAPGVREVVADKQNGLLLKEEKQSEFAGSINQLLDYSAEKMEEMRQAARRTAKGFSAETCTEKLIALYNSLPRITRQGIVESETFWRQTVEALKAEWDLLSNYKDATAATLRKRKGRDRQGEGERNL